MPFKPCRPGWWPALWHSIWSSWSFQVHQSARCIWKPVASPRRNDPLKKLKTPRSPPSDCINTQQTGQIQMNQPSTRISSATLCKGTDDLQWRSGKIHQNFIALDGSWIADTNLPKWVSKWAASQRKADTSQLGLWLVEELEQLLSSTNLFSLLAFCWCTPKLTRLHRV